MSVHFKGKANKTGCIVVRLHKPDPNT